MPFVNCFQTLVNKLLIAKTGLGCNNVKLCCANKQILFQKIKTLTDAINSIALSFIRWLHNTTNVTISIYTFVNRIQMLVNYLLKGQSDSLIMPIQAHICILIYSGIEIQHTQYNRFYRPGGHRGGYYHAANNA